MLLSTAIERYLLDLEERTLSKAHIETVTYRLRRFLEWLGDNKPLGQIARIDIAHYFRHEEGRGMADGSLASFRGTQSAFWNFCDENGWCDGNLASRVKRYSARPVNRKAASENDVQTVAEKLPAYAARRDYRPADVRNALLVSLSIDSGARLGALHNLTNEAMQDALAEPLQTDAGQVVYVARSTGKTGPCSVVFFADSADLYRRWREMQSSRAVHVFTNAYTGDQLHRNSAGAAFATVCRWCGVKPLRSQAIRKANVTGVIRLSDLAVGQQYAGHSSMAVTREFYYEVSRQDTLDAAAELAARRRRNVRDDEMAKLFGVNQ